MLQNKDFQPTQGLQPYAKCADCPMFSDFQDSRNRGWCSAFEKLFQKALETVDLVFLDGIDWKAFLLSLKELQNEYGQENVDVQGIEKRPGGSFVVRIEVPPEVNKAEIESKAKQSYETQLKIIEVEHRAELRSLEAHYQDKIIKLHEKQGSDMMEIAKLLASRPYYISKKQRGLLGVLYI